MSIIKTKKIVCKDCGQEFDFDEISQEFYAKNGWSQPKRCPACRKKNKLARETKDAELNAYIA